MSYSIDEAPSHNEIFSLRAVRFESGAGAGAGADPGAGPGAGDGASAGAVAGAFAGPMNACYLERLRLYMHTTAAPYKFILCGHGPGSAMYYKESCQSLWVRSGARH